MEKNYKLEGIILKRKNYAEADRLLTIFTKQKGKICCLAKGVRKINSKRAPFLELFNQIRLYLVKGWNFDLISEVELIQNFPHIQRKLTKISQVYWLVELIEKLSAEGQKNLIIYNLLLTYLEKINKENYLPTELMLEFQKKLLLTLGFGLPKIVNQKNLDKFIEHILNKKINSRKLLC